MNKILLALFLLTGIHAYTKAQSGNPDTIIIRHSFQKPVGFVNDFENILDSATTETALTGLIIAHEKKTTNQVAVVTIDNFGEYRNDITTYSIDLFNTWGIGQKDKNNGVLITVSKTQQMVNISPGKGLINVLNAIECKRIIEKVMIPRFKENNYATGITDGVNEIIRILEQ